MLNRQSVVAGIWLMGSLLWLGENPRVIAADLERATGEILERTNDFREEQGLDRLSTNDKLTATARYFARYMAEHDQYGHEADGQRPADRAREHDYELCLVAENIAYYQSTRVPSAETLARRFVQGWIDSPGHRRNLVDADMTETGVAVARSSESGTYYAVQMFGRPRAQAIQFTIANRSGEEIEYEVDDQTHTLPPRYAMTHQQCRPSPLRIVWPERDTTRLRPEDGDRFTIVGDRGERLRLRRE